jgi:hypothetical protein
MSDKTARPDADAKHPMNERHATPGSTEQTDKREEADNPDRHTGQYWPGDTAPEEEFRTNTPSRRDTPDSVANDSY